MSTAIHLDTMAFTKPASAHHQLPFPSPSSPDETYHPHQETYNPAFTPGYTPYTIYLSAAPIRRDTRRLHITYAHLITLYALLAILIGTIAGLAVVAAKRPAKAIVSQAIAAPPAVPAGSTPPSINFAPNISIDTGNANLAQEQEQRSSAPSTTFSTVYLASGSGGFAEAPSVQWRNGTVYRTVMATTTGQGSAMPVTVMATTTDVSTAERTATEIEVSTSLMTIGGSTVTSVSIARTTATTTAISNQTTTTTAVESTTSIATSIATSAQTATTTQIATTLSAQTTTVPPPFKPVPPLTLSFTGLPFNQGGSS
ncbi:hypothetical protein EJ06DRAFT_48704 [Trichodelitschia bisporula]|uniref:Uncharacterized protein n=1 Tax=Trichodelitschia bisporula TaxID=703511 RepID=A0A6G1HTL4_9PEZI|nr:hypothetical protein EJ06DRAFT_48704 [Trichodelitschia bisporula]